MSTIPVKYVREALRLAIKNGNNPDELSTILTIATYCVRGLIREGDTREPGEIAEDLGVPTTLAKHTARALELFKDLDKLEESAAHSPSQH